MGSPTQGWSPGRGRERIGLLLVVVKWYMVAMFMVPILVLLDTEPALASPVSGPCGECLPQKRLCRVTVGIHSLGPWMGHSSRLQWDTAQNPDAPCMDTRSSIVDCSQHPVIGAHDDPPFFPQEQCWCLQMEYMIRSFFMDYPL